MAVSCDRLPNMDSAKHHQVIQQILSPTLNTNEKDEILNDLGLNGLPSREHVHREIEEKLLLPQETLPSHWLPSYQVYDCTQAYRLNFTFVVGIGTRVYRYLRCLLLPPRHRLRACLLFELD